MTIIVPLKNQEELAYSRVRSKTQGITVEIALTPSTPVYPIIWLNAVVALTIGAPITGLTMYNSRL